MAKETPCQRPKQTMGFMSASVAVNMKYNNRFGEKVENSPLGIFALPRQSTGIILLWDYLLTAPLVLMTESSY